MRVWNVLLVSLLVCLYGCQPDAPTPPKAAAPAAVEPVVSSQPAESAATAPAPINKVEPALVEKNAQPSTGEKAVATEKKKSPQPAVVEVPTAPTLAPVVVAPTAKVEPPPVVETKPEVQPEPVISEAEGMQLAQKSGCLACHAVDKKKVGPAFKDVAAKYRGDAEAEARLAGVIAKGGRGVWGVMSMPPSPQVSEANRKILVKFVLSLK